jgi:hypothetical protein
LSALVSAAVVVLPVSAVISAAAASPLSPPVGKVLAELKGSATLSGDAVGVSVAISGETALVGAPGYAKDLGLVYVFAELGSGWRQSAELKGAGTVASDFFGYSVAVSGATAAVGTPGYAKNAGRVFVFQKTAKGWKQTAVLKGSDTGSGDYFGDAVAISSTTVLVGADGHAKNAGRTYVFTYGSAGWKQAAELRGSDTAGGDGFGYTVAISGDSAIVGAPDHSKNAGRAYVFAHSGSSWTQITELKGSDTVSDNGFGVSVAISGDTAIVGAPGFDKAVGRSYIFSDAGTGWTQAAELKGSGTVASDAFGYSAATSGNVVVLGAPGCSKAAGRTFVFVRSKSAWSQAAELKGSDTVAGDYFGYSAAISGTTAIAGADGHAKSAGRAYLFQA